MVEDVTAWPSYKALETLPLFNAFLKEVLRVWPTLPGSLERSVPEGGTVIAGVFIPEGTEVTMTAYTMHRDQDIFPDALSFKPERWLNETSEMRDAFIPFSYGPRACAGQKFVFFICQEACSELNITIQPSMVRDALNTGHSD